MTAFIGVPVECLTLWSLAHIFEKGFEAIEPALADLDASTAVSFP
jgi:hypothetical protein